MNHVEGGGAGAPPTHQKKLLSECDRWEGMNHSPSLVDSAPNSSMRGMDLQVARGVSEEAKKD